jgi:FimV-like protein
MSWALLHRNGWAGWVALLALTGSSAAYAAGLGAIQVHSPLGEPLRVSVALLGNDAAVHEAACVKAKVASLDGALVINPAVRMVRSAAANAILLTSQERLNEPVLNISVEVACGTPIQREYQVLLDPVAVPTAASVIAGTPTALTTRRPSSVPRTLSSEADVQAAPKRRHRKQTARAQEARRVLAVPAVSAAPKAAAEAETNSATRSVLKMSRAPEQADKPLVVTRLDTADVQTTVLKEQDAASSENASRNAEMLALIRALHEETRALRAETSRMQQQYVHDRSEIESMRQESQLWMRSLLALLLVCAATIAWLLWRMYAMKKNAARVSWNELFSDTTSATQHGPQTEFTTTSFQITSFDTSESPATETANTTAGNTFFPEPEPAPLAKAAAAAAGPTSPSETESGKPFKYSSGGAIPYLFSNQVDSVDTHAAPEHALKAEEISEVMELAEMWMSMHDPAAVERLLEPFSQAHHLQSPLPLLCLLDVYRALGKRDKHDAIAKRIKATFNVNPASWQTDASPARTLANYPHVREQVLALWESGEAAAYLDSLVLDNRHGLREGFDLPAYRDILRLKGIASRRAPYSRTGPAMEPEAYAILFTEEHRIRTHEPPAISALKSQEPAPQMEIATEAEVGSASPASAMREDMSPMSIKLHLALAYQDIGDKEGSVLLLEEVIQGGNEEQRTEARQLIATLSAAELSLQ